MSDPVNILLVDDDARNLDVLESILESPDCRMVRAQTADAALMALVQQEFAGIVLDIQMPGMSGLELARLIKTRRRSQHVPIIFLTAHFQEDKDVLQGYGAGAVDYLTKPVNPQILKSKVGAFAELFRATRALQKEVAQRQSAEEALRQANAELEARVQERTADLSRANRDLRVSEERYRLILENALEYAIFTLDRDGHVTTWNAGAQRILGYEEPEILGQRLDTIFPAQDRERGYLDLEMARAVSHGRSQDERWRLRKDGSPFWAASLMTPLKDEEGRHLGFLKILRDRTNRKRNEEALRQSEARFRLLIEGAPNAMLMVDDTGAITLVNAQTEKLFGYSRDQLLSQPVEMLVPARYRGAHPQHRASFLQAPASRPMGAGRDLFGLRKDGTEVPIEIGLNPLRIGERPFVVASIIDITERKRAAAALRDSEERFALFMKHLPGAAWMKDTDGRYVFANETSEQIFQRALSDLRNKTDEEIFPPEIAAQFRANDRRALESGQGIQTVETLPQPDGIHHSVVSKFPIFGPDGKPMLVGGVAIDITERKRAEETIRTQAAQIRLITDTTPIMLTRCSRDRRYEFVNRAYAEMLGLTPEQVIGKSIPEVMGQDGYRTILPYVETVLQGQPVEYEAEVPFQRVGRRFLRVAYMPDRDETGLVRGWVASLSDITDRKQSEQRAVRLNETLLSMLEAIPDIVFVTETSGRIQFRNPAADRFASAVGIGRQLPPPIQAELEHVMETGEHHLPTSFKTVHRFMIQREERFFLSRIVPMTTPDDRTFGAVVMLQDVTEFRLLDEVKTNLISTVSHELKTPMTSLRTALLLLLEQSLGQLNAQQAEMAGIARDEAERLLRTLNELLDLTRFEESTMGMRLEPVSPGELVQAAVEETHMASEAAGTSVRVELPLDLPVVQADRERIVHVLTNFLTNAIKYSPEGGEIIVRAQKSDEGVNFSVRDHGPGVPSQYQSRVFERFVRVPGTPKKGVGLGLSIAREFIRAHRGRIGVRSEPGQGSEFYFILPLE